MRWRWRPGLLYLGTLALLASSAAVLIALDRGSRVIAIGATVGMAIAAVLFVLSLFPPRNKVDWKRIQAEQRLWESGPLGRAWLRIRQRLSNLWKL